MKNLTIKCDGNNYFRVCFKTNDNALHRGVLVIDKKHNVLYLLNDAVGFEDIPAGIATIKTMEYIKMGLTKVWMLSHDLYDEKMDAIIWSFEKLSWRCLTPFVMINLLEYSLDLPLLTPSEVLIKKKIESLEDINRKQERAIDEYKKLNNKYLLIIAADEGKFSFLDEAALNTFKNDVLESTDDALIEKLLCQIK